MKFTPTHIIVLLIVLILVFSSTKLPQIASSLGQSMKVFKKEIKELRDEDTTAASGQQAPAQIQQPAEGTYYTQPTQTGQAAPQQPTETQK